MPASTYLASFGLITMILIIPNGQSSIPEYIDPPFETDHVMSVAPLIRLNHLSSSQNSKGPTHKCTVNRF